MPITGSCHCGKTAYEIAGDIPPSLTRCTCSFCSKRGHCRIGVNARLFDDFDAATAPVPVIDGKNLW